MSAQSSTNHRPSKDAPEKEDTAGSAVSPLTSVDVATADKDFYDGFTPAQRRRVRTKIDVRLLPVLCVLYLFAQLDRANIGNAKIEGLKEDTHMTDKQYNLVLACFFIPTVLLEVPSNMFVKGLKRPSIYLGALAFFWGIIMMCHAFAQDFKDLLIMRLLLGAAESGFYPAAVYLCSQWYQRHDLAIRLALFTSISAAAGIASGLLAAAIAKLDGVNGYEGWRWIFFLEGSATIVLGLLTGFLLIDTPAVSTGWLTADERRFLDIQQRIKEGNHMAAVVRPSKRDDLKSVVLSWRYWAFGFMFHAALACGYGLKFSMPVILKGMGYGKGQAQLLSSVPYIFGVVSALGTAMASDFFGCRSIFIIGGYSTVLLGLGLILGLGSSAMGQGDQRAGAIAGLCLMTSGIFAASPSSNSWLANNIASPGRRAVGIAFATSIGGLGGFTGSFIFDEGEAPVFRSAFGISCGLAVFVLLVTAALSVSYWRANKRKDSMSEAEVRQMYAPEELAKMGEESPLFRYTL